MKRVFVLVLMSLFLGCSSDNTSNQNADDDIVGFNTLEEMIQDMTSGSERTWSIQNATLTNENVANLNVTFAFNIEDDEFVFSDNNDLTVSLEWRKNNSINSQASTFDEVLVDYLRSPENAVLSFSSDTDYFNNNFSDSANKFNMGYIDDNVLEGIIDYGNNAMLRFTLVPQSAPVIPQSLTFTELFTFSSLEQVNEVKLLGSNTLNSLFISFSEQLVPVSRKLRFLKYNLNSTELFENVENQSSEDSQGSGITNNLESINGQIYLMGFGIIMKFSPFDLNINSSSSYYSDPNQIGFNGHETTNLEDEIYIIGGGYESQFIYDQIRVFNINEIELGPNIITMPNAKQMTGASIVNNKMYIFGGSANFITEIGTQDIFIYNFDSGLFDTSIQLPLILADTFTSVKGNLIYVGGKRFVDSSGNLTGSGPIAESFLGVFNTLDNTFTEINLPFPSGGNVNALQEIAIIGNQLYVIYGPSETSSNIGGTWSVQVANLN